MDKHNFIFIDLTFKMRVITNLQADMSTCLARFARAKHDVGQLETLIVQLYLKFENLYQVFLYTVRFYHFE